ncbi:hypothetical protein BOTBODRAFT_173079 [Botryobasidium botryosum FD-172 SS1]|uniref:Uncharacterized protein n=1 Tax=Botryobasidium botryosum (strain FD-172 SS1) TaxID=930990 RepID=A0A067MXF0_BOTB1|nr:hypothetical protein BOTBODRAFT_173079 [Botryobasidium botryosum FD-172 SS1]
MTRRKATRSAAQREQSAQAFKRAQAMRWRKPLVSQSQASDASISSKPRDKRLRSPPGSSAASAPKETGQKSDRAPSPSHIPNALTLSKSPTPRVSDAPARSKSRAKSSRSGKKVSRSSKENSARVAHNLRHQVKRAQVSRGKAQVEVIRAKEQAAKALHAESKAVSALAKARQETQCKVQRVTERLEKKIATLQVGHASDQQEIARVRAAAIDEVGQLCLEVKKLGRSLSDSEKHVEKLRARKDAMKKKISALRMGNARSLVQQQKAVAKAGRHCLKSKGVINPRSRDMIRRLLGIGTAMTRVDETVDIVLEGVGQQKVDSVDRRSVSRINREGGVAANVQMGYELSQSQSELIYCLYIGRAALNFYAACSVSGDATTHKHINYESKHIMLTVPDYNAPPSTSPPESTVPTQRFLGINTSVNHTSETQLQGWKDVMGSIFEAYNAAPIGKKNPLDVRNFACAVKGMNTDHAEDQKKLFREFEGWKEICEQELRGEAVLRSSELADIHPILWEEIARVVNEAGGQEAWDALPLDEKEKRNEEAHTRACRRIGKERLDALTPEERCYIALFIWGGCCMHKEMNSIKGEGCSNGGDNMVAAAGGDAATKERVMEAAQGGAIKLASLAGSVFAHKDKKKGQQDTLQVFMESIFGYMARFPDTSNTRYQSYCDAAAELITQLDFYHSFLELVCDLKEKQVFTNMEKNVYDALADIPTLTELCVLVIYSQTISCPFMRDVCSPTQAQTNLLELGPKLMGVIAHIDKLDNDTSLALSPEATYETGALDGKLWEQPDAFYAVQALAPRLPHLEGAFRAFLKGAHATWVRFTSEFDSGGRIDAASPSERHLAFMKPTNDDNEGALAAFRQDMYHTPRLTIQQFNATRMYRKNDTYSFMKRCFGPEDHRAVMAHARMLDASQIPQAERAAQVKYYEETQAQKLEDDAKRQAKADAKNETLDGIELHLNVPDLILHPPICAILDLELDWHRRNGDTQVPMKKDVKHKANKVYALAAAVERYHAARLPQHSLEGIASSSALPKVPAGPIDDDLGGGSGEDYRC